MTQSEHERRYGLIAGNGRFPFLVLEGARRRGIEMVVAAIREETSPEIERQARLVRWLGVGQLGHLIEFFREHGVTHAVLAGQVKHVQIFGPALPDWRMVKLLLRLPHKNTNSLIGAVVAELEREGIQVVDSTLFVAELLAPEGVLTARAPSRSERDDLQYGLEIAREIARLDLGQTIAVKDRAIVAIEAMEGTDATIRRAASLLGGRPFVVVKVARPNQDMRFDVPVIGVPTIETMIECHATALAITAHKTLLLDRDELIALANRHRIAVLAVP
ncbi:MAG: UDP-2,3-diacylglucosamine diphosphatase LpxI [Blastocatellia bacterium]|nr:UDP-2,3-diacylglucosamine diphosphatase LpxI [Blastocatellia bacterium]MCS7158147.1 UDP-2,3-diacylglucosamine diphosphatase LpxI [Blastocatellia bacterium]MCX7752990.1 UDP-2,3-diacylglucosamine diphosphatase LpxI [Blastocatellia bacterium]MDW8168513.1 UDP-2,3-diacylglucosamine diphosphatase LpxI [Acidobacteriota bacterium]MDW8256927.1 UDP-2,3-diacylglucosamine diphosphatase LpxI [Acidobacteriota bacterium]